MSLPSEGAEPANDASASPAVPLPTPQPDDSAAYRRLFKATSVIGGAQVISIVIGIARTKVFALLVGPAGVGLFGLLNTLMTTAGTVMQMGMGAVGTRQIAEAHATGDMAQIALARRALMLATLALSLIGGGGVWLLREPLALHVLRNAALADAVGWIGLGVGLSVAAMGQTSLIQGMSRMWDLAWLRIGGALLVALIGLPLVWAFGEAAIPYFVILAPLASFAIGQVFVARIGKAPSAPASLTKLAGQWRMFLVLGLPIVVSSLVGMAVTVWVQAHIKTELGLAALGFYVASNTIASQYSSLVLTAMMGDYFPRLSGVIHDRAAARDLVNQQTEVVILLAGPLILGIFAFAPLVISLLYSSEFVPAANVLRWQAIGTLFIVIGWPMSFILLAAGAGRAYFVTAVVPVVVMAGATWLLMDRYGLDGAGMGYFAAYLVYLPLQFALAAPQIGFFWNAAVWRALAILTIAFAGLLWPVLAPSLASIIIGSVVAGVAGAYLALRASRTLNLMGLINRYRGAKQ
jgi:PST family polysaccharide transporter